MDNKTFIKTVYEPYNECWAIIKTIQNSRRSGPKEEWKDWEKMTDEFSKKHDDMVGHILSQMLYSLGDEIGKINDTVREI